MSLHLVDVELPEGERFEHTSCAPGERRASSSSGVAVVTRCSPSATSADALGSFAAVGDRRSVLRFARRDLELHVGRPEAETLRGRKPAVGGELQGVGDRRAYVLPVVLLVGWLVPAGLDLRDGEPGWMVVVALLGIAVQVLTLSKLRRRRRETTAAATEPGAPASA